MTPCQQWCPYLWRGQPQEPRERLALPTSGSSPLGLSIWLHSGILRSFGIAYAGSSDSTGWGLSIETYFLQVHRQGAKVQPKLRAVTSPQLTERESCSSPQNLVLQWEIRMPPRLCLSPCRMSWIEGEAPRGVPASVSHWGSFLCQASRSEL